MDKRRVRRAGVAVAALAAFIALTVSASVADESEVCHVIRIKQEKGAAGSRLDLRPLTAQVPKGACVIWVNWVPQTRVRVVFKEHAEACQKATDAPSGFKEVENCYLSEFIPLGKTVSLYFHEAGTFKYHVEVPDTTKFTPDGINPGKIEGSGEIHVR